MGQRQATRSQNVQQSIGLYDQLNNLSSRKLALVILRTCEIQKFATKSNSSQSFFWKHLGEGKDMRDKSVASKVNLGFTPGKKIPFHSPTFDMINLNISYWILSMPDIYFPLTKYITSCSIHLSAR